MVECFFSGAVELRIDEGKLFPEEIDLFSLFLLNQKNRVFSCFFSVGFIQDVRVFQNS